MIFLIFLLKLLGRYKIGVLVGHSNSIIFGVLTFSCISFAFSMPMWRFIYRTALKFQITKILLAHYSGHNLYFSGQGLRVFKMRFLMCRYFGVFNSFRCIGDPRRWGGTGLVNIFGFKGCIIVRQLLCAPCCIWIFHRIGCCFVIYNVILE